MKKYLCTLTSIILLLLCFVSCNSSNNNIKKNKSKNLTITADQLNVVLGKTTLQELINKGFTFDYSSSINDSLNPKSSMPISIEIKKDKKSFASVGLANNSNSKKKFEDCIISAISFYISSNDDFNSLHKFSKITVNKGNIIGLSKNDIITEFDISEDKNSNTLNFSHSGCNYEFNFDDNNTLCYACFDINE